MIKLAILLLLVSMSSPMHWLATAQTDFVKGVCKMARDYEGCLQALGSDPRASTTKDLKTLAIICLDQATANTTDTIEFIKKMGRDPTTSPALKAVLEECVTGYESARGSYQGAKTELSPEGLQGANYDIIVAQDGPYFCKDELEKHGFDVPEISNRLKHVGFYSNIGDVITTAMIASLPPPPMAS